MLAMASTENQEDKALASSTTNPVGLEIQRLQQQINAARKDLDIINNRKKNIHLVCDQVSGWAGKTAMKLNTIILDDTKWVEQEGLPQHISVKTGGKDGGRMALSEVFSNISNVVCSKLNHMIQQQIDRKNHDIAAGIIRDEDEYQAQDIMNDDYNQREIVQDFATEEFI